MPIKLQEVVQRWFFQSRPQLALPSQQQTDTTMQEYVHQLEAELRDVRRELQSSQKQVSDYKRLHAELTRDYKRLSSQESQEKVRHQARIEVIKQLLEPMEDTNRAVAYTPGDIRTSDWFYGLMMSHEKMSDRLNEWGLRRFGHVNEVFDPHIHSAVGETQHNDIEEGKISQVIAQGYHYRGTLIRAAQVYVAVSQCVQREPHERYRATA